MKVLSRFPHQHVRVFIGIYTFLFSPHVIFTWLGCPNFSDMCRTDMYVSKSLPTSIVSYKKFNVQPLTKHIHSRKSEHHRQQHLSYLKIL